MGLRIGYALTTNDAKILLGDIFFQVGRSLGLTIIAATLESGNAMEDDAIAASDRAWRGVAAGIVRLAEYLEESE